MNCNFGENEDDVIRDQIIDKCVSNELRRKLLESENLTLDTAIKTARAHEAVDRQARVMERREGDINSIKPKTKKEVVKPGVSAKTCFACGGEGHFAKDKKCPARGKKCRLCGKTGHYQDKCFKAGRKQKVYHVDNSDEDTDDSSGHAFAIGRTGSGTVLEVGNVSTEFIIDSGASSNVVSGDTWEILKSKHIKCKSRKSAKVLFAYASSEPLKSVGTFNALVSSQDTGVQIRADFVVVEGNGQSLLGRSSAEALKLLRVGPERPAVLSIVEENSAGDIKDKYPDLFKDVGLLKDYSLKLNIDDNVEPVAQSLRRVPFGLREKVEKKLQELLALDIIEEAPEGPSRWVSPLVVVPKAGGDVRICVDMREANRAIMRERQPIPTVEELLNDMNSSTVFSKLDLKMGFHQVQLHEDSRHITTFVSSLSLFRYKRLMFGISSAPEKYQQIVRDVLRGCTGVANIADDIIVHGKTVEEHDKRLHDVLCTLQEKGMTLNPKKCAFRLSKLVFFGHELTNKGVNPSEEKVAAIKDAKPPQNVSEVRSFMGLVQYSAKFIPDLATVAKPIQELTRKSTTFKWGTAQQEAFDELKQRLCSAETLAYFDVKRQTRIVADASPCGLGAILVQKHDDLWRVVSYASRSLTDVERKYSQTEREALALVWACERFNMYIFGLQFELETDHKPLEHIYSRRSKPSARLERWVLRLQAYDFKVVYRPGKSNIADCLSRLNQSVQRDKGTGYDFVRSIVEFSVPVAMTVEEVQIESAKDQELSVVRECIKTGDWSKSELSYVAVKNELCIVGDIVMRGSRIVIPKVLRNDVLKLAHEGHQGIVKMKNRLRSKVWWPKIDNDAERVCRSCHGCQVVGGYNPPEPMARTMPPSSAWQDIAIDLLGPIPTGESILVTVDYYSRYYEVNVLKSVTSSVIIQALRGIFARYGFPHSLKSDNGRQFVSEEFENFLTECGIEHRKSPPLWPAANGEVEAQNRSLVKMLKIAKVEGKQWKLELVNFLMAYRSTPQVTTGQTPYFLMFGREMRTKLPELRVDKTLRDEGVRDKDWEQKLRGKVYVDQKVRAKPSDVSVGQSVLLKSSDTGKLATKFESEPYKVVNKQGSEVTVQSKEGVEYKRNSSFVKPYEKADNSDMVEENKLDPPSESRPSRERKMPAKFNDYVVKY